MIYLMVLFPVTSSDP